MRKSRLKRTGVCQGSFTVEAAMVMPLVLLVIMGILYLFFFVHNRAWLTAAAYEAAVSGSMEGIKKDGKADETARMKSEMLGNTGFIGGENLSSQVHVGKAVTVIYRMDTPAEFLGDIWKIRVEGNAEIVRPVSWIRKVKAAADIVKELEE